MINLNYEVDYACKKSSTDVTLGEFRLIADCIAELL